MTSDARSLSILAAVANEQRATTQLANSMPLIQARRQSLMPQMQGARPISRQQLLSLVQGAVPLGQGSLPLLARQLMLPTGTTPQRIVPTIRRPSVTTSQRPAVVAKPGTASTRTPKTEDKVPAATETKPVVVVQPPPPTPTPKKYLQDLFLEHDIGESKLPKRYARGDFVKPDDEECKSYAEAAPLVRTNELDKLRTMHEEGKNLDACNRVGESLLHLACRRGHVEIAEFLMKEAKVRWDLQDDFGRTVLHDACWRPTPSVELMDVILRVVSPEWLMASDIRGHTPFDYARREHRATWYDFLKEREDTIAK